MKIYDKILDSEFRKLIISNSKDAYCVLIQVYYDNNEMDIELRLKNKRRLEDFVTDNKIHIYNDLEFLPQMSLKMTGEQIQEIIKEDYVQYATKGNEIVSWGV